MKSLNNYSSAIFGIVGMLLSVRYFRLIRNLLKKILTDIFRDRLKKLKRGEYFVQFI